MIQAYAEFSNRAYIRLTENIETNWNSKTSKMLYAYCVFVQYISTVGVQYNNFNIKYYTSLFQYFYWSDIVPTLGENSNVYFENYYDW